MMPKWRYTHPNNFTKLDVRNVFSHLVNYYLQMYRGMAPTDENIEDIVNQFVRLWTNAGVKVNSLRKFCKEFPNLTRLIKDEYADESTRNLRKLENAITDADVELVRKLLKHKLDVNVELEVGGRAVMPNTY
eukprot:UN29666